MTITHPATTVATTGNEDALNVLSGLLGPVEVISSREHRLDPGESHTPVTGTAQALQRVARDDYTAWLDHIAPAAACTRPIRLRGESLVISETTGRVLSVRSTDDMPDGVLYKACGNRRAAVCPACAEVYRADTYQLVRAGLNGGKGVPATVQAHPFAFVTFTAPSFGPVHGTRTIRARDGQLRHRVCRPRRDPDPCPHGIDLRCRHTHHDGESILGKPLCLDCYDHDHQVVWNVMSGELWRRTTDRIKDILATWGLAHGVRLRLSFAKVAEMQARGVAHFHALIRLDGNTEGLGAHTHQHRISDKTGKHLACTPRRNPETCPHSVTMQCFAKHTPDDPALDQPLCPQCADDDTSGRSHWTTPHLGADFTLLEAAIRRAVTTTRFRTPAHPDNPDGWLIEWGKQLDVRPVRLTTHSLDDGVITESAVAGYLAKYATKATEATGHISSRITTETIQHYTENRTHAARLIDACWRLGRPGADLDPDQATKNSGRLSYTRLRRWAHVLGFGGHFSTKSRRYSTTLRALRETRANWRRDQHRTADHIDDRETTLIIGNFTYADTGWRTIGDALLANTAAAKARDHRLVAREQQAEVEDHTD